MDSLQAQYLENMGVPVWLSRDRERPVAAPACLLALGPGSGSRLFVCGSTKEQSGRLAADLARALPEPPVWAWPVEEQGVGVAQVVEDRLFTSLVVFGQDLAQAVIGNPVPELLASARVVVLPALGELATSAQARRKCWRLMTAGGVAGAP
jgi:hypothetical protein